MDFLVDNNNEALKKLSNQEEIPQSQSMLTDILTATERKQKRKRDENEDRNDDTSADDLDDLLNTMSVNLMRKKLDDRGLSVDGTRDMLIGSMKKYVCLEEVVVEGAGVHGANGTYKIGGFYNGTFMYKKSGQYGEEEKAFTIYCYGKNMKSWYISILGGDNPDDEGAIDFYETDCSNKITPPTGKWRLCEEEYVPAPTISLGDRTE